MSLATCAWVSALSLVLSKAYVRGVFQPHGYSCHRGLRDLLIAFRIHADF
ncbi:hypothetical protein [Pseudoalteromonas sp. S185]|nr:hypothetical protein [Pseudoalteromonas sp. S185]